jgi:ketosteroid isomerase-like protein
MSQENVEIVYRLGEAFNRHDLEALRELSDSDVEFVSALTAIEADGATYRGPGLWVDYFAVMDEAWEEWQVEDLEVFDAGEDRAAAVLRLVGQGKNSGARTSQRIGLSYRFREGKVWRIRAYLDPDLALEAVGLRE